MLFRVVVYEQTPPEAILDWDLEVINPKLQFASENPSQEAQPLLFDEATITINELPFSPSPITAIQYRVDSGDWQTADNLSSFVIYFSPKTSFDLYLRAVNVNGEGPESCKAISIERDPASSEMYERLGAVKYSYVLADANSDGIIDATTVMWNNQNILTADPPDEWTYCRGTLRESFFPGQPSYPLPFPSNMYAIVRQRPIVTEISP